MEEIIIIGGGGHAKVVIEAVKRSSFFKPAGIIDSLLPKGTVIEGISVLGNDDHLLKVYKEGVRNVFVAIGSVGDVSVRKKFANILSEIGFNFPCVIDKSAFVASSVKLGRGVFVAAGAVIQPAAVIGDFAIINSCASIDHDCKIGKFVHISPGSVLSGNVEVGDGTHIGTGSSVIEKRKIGSNCIIGAGSVVVNDISNNCKAFGNPCKIRSSLLPKQA